MAKLPSETANFLGFLVATQANGQADCLNFQHRVFNYTVFWIKFVVMVGSKRLLSSSGAAAATAKSCGLMLELRLKESGEAFKSEQKAITALLSFCHST